MPQFCRYFAIWTDNYPKTREMQPVANCAAVAAMANGSLRVRAVERSIPSGENGRGLMCDLWSKEQNRAERAMDLSDEMTGSA